MTESSKPGNANQAPRILGDKYRVRYLKLIAIFKMLKGVFLLCLGVSLVFLNSRNHWLDSISDWATDELLVVHSRPLHYLFHLIQRAVTGEHLRATGVLSLFYSAMLLTEGTAVYLQKRWGEFLMIIGTAALIPLEVHHLFVKPGLVAVAILIINCFIVWFLYRVLRWERPHRPAPVRSEMAHVA